MKILKKIQVVIICFLLTSFATNYGQEVVFKDTTSFYPEWKGLEKENINWGYLSVPENWEDSGNKRVDLAVAILKNTSGIQSEDPVLYIPGGPGGDGIQSLGFWLNHPLRAKNDIVIFDMRGTGLSVPRFCPDLGKEFLKILSKNQSEEEDEKQKKKAAMSCKNELESKGIDLSMYNSRSIAMDLNALKSQLGYSKWHVYGVSYGTYMAQVYANTFPGDIKSIILDSSISDITKYYTQNTTGYIDSLSKIFEICKNDNDCNSNYPDLEKIYFQTIEDLNSEPLTVDIDSSIIESGKFTYNAEDFKVAVQQALYNEKLIPLIPLLIYEFNHRNKMILGDFVSAFSGALEMDYGVYYTISCNEILPFNSLSEYEKDAMRYEKLDGGIAFYKSDFAVCEAWNANRSDSLGITPIDLTGLKDISVPVLVFAGGFDPITPESNAIQIQNVFQRTHLVNVPNDGHTPGFSEKGRQIVHNFVATPNGNPSNDYFRTGHKPDFVKNIRLNSGIAKFGRSLNQPNLIFLGPLGIAVCIMLVFSFVYLSRLLTKGYKTLSDKLLRVFVTITSVIGIASFIGLAMALDKVAKQNTYILAFGLPDSFNYLFIGINLFMLSLMLTLMFYVASIKKTKDRSITLSVIFSNVLLAIYIFYWGIF